MTHSKQAAKRVRQSERNRERNRSIRSAVRTAVKQVLSAPTRADALVLLPGAVQRLDKAAKVRVIHRNAAARQKSRLARVVAAKT
jgi:small subunit ribosomal protein S20